MNLLQAYIATIIIFLLAFIGLGAITKMLATKIKQLQKPKVALRVNASNMKKAAKLVEGFGLEEKLFLVELILGGCDCIINLDQGTARIKAVGSIDDLDKLPRMEYTG